MDLGLQLHYDHGVHLCLERDLDLVPDRVRDLDFGVDLVLVRYLVLDVVLGIFLDRTVRSTHYMGPARRAIN